ncbi:MAG: hypothetical protein D3907_14445, partial [Candidatus Electrothrix sp. AUS3]|nr:hypothetical protein [Candidatus Electrothrix gigas]
DGGLAIEAELNHPDDVVVDQFGNIFIADAENNRIRKVDTNGIITTVAGNGTEGSNGDGGPAIDAELNYPFEVAVDEVGNIFIVNRIGAIDLIRKVDANGNITTVAGGGSSLEDNILAIQAKITSAGIVVDQAGNFFIADDSHHRIRKVDSSGIITTVAGTGSSGYRGDGGLAIMARLDRPKDVALDQAGNLFIADYDNSRIRKIDPNGIITTVAGNGSSGSQGDGGAATEASLYRPLEVAVDQLGNVFIAEYDHHRIRKVEFASAVFKSDLLAPGEIPFADPNGLGYIMSATGLHKKTIDLDSGLVLQEFAYDADDKLISISDQFGNVTSIERDTDGTPTAIVSPDGLRTKLHINADKQLTQIVYPDSTAYSFTYTADDLMTVEEEPNGNRFEHNFDKNGKIVKVLDEEGGDWQYTRQRLANGDVRIESLTAEGNRTTNLDNTASTGAFSTTTIDPSGNQSTFSRSADGLSEERELSCGMTSWTDYGLDAEYKYKVVRSTSTQSPAGLTKIAQIDKTYQDTDANELPDLITETVSSDGRLTTLVHNTLTGEKTVTTPEGRTVTSQYDPATMLTSSV